MENKIQIIKQHLSDNSDDLKSDLIGIKSGNYRLYEENDLENIHSLDFEIHYEDFGICLYPMDKDLTKLGFMQLVTTYGILEKKNFKMDFSNLDDSKIIVEFSQKLEKLILDWFIHNWNSIENNKFNFQIYLQIHDDNKRYDLINNKWI